MDHDNFLVTLNKFIQVTEDIIGKLREELDWIEGHHKRCIAAKAVGTTTSVVGSAVLIGSLLLAPITGGASIVVATGYGAMTAVAGAGINLVTDLTDMITQRIEKGQIEDICARRNQIANDLKEYFEEMERVAGKLRELNVDEERAYILSLGNIISKGNMIKTSAEDIIKLSRCAQVASGTSNMLLRNGGYFWKGMRLQSEGLMKALAFFGFNVSKTGAMAVIRSGTIVLNGAFAIYDVYSLIQTIKNNHPTADAISEMIKQMNEELVQIGQLRDITLEFEKN